jgi:uncharacterized protein YcfJ
VAADDERTVKVDVGAHGLKQYDLRVATVVFMVFSLVAAGAYGGNQVQKNMQEKDVVNSTEARCRTVNVRSEKLLGYDVTYRLEGKEGTVRMSFNPGKQIPVRDGQLVLGPVEPDK